jgi:hypothetical protein
MSSPCGVTTVHAKVATSHEAAGVAKEEDCCTAVLVRSGKSAEHVLLGPLVAALGELLEQLLDHGGDNVSRGDGVDADIVLTPFRGEVTAKLEHGSLTGIVSGADETLQHHESVVAQKVKRRKNQSGESSRAGNG